MVWMRLPTTVETGVTQDRTASPSTRTVQAPQAATPQPNLVPVMFNTSRNTHNRGMLGSASAVMALPLIRSSTPPPQLLAQLRRLYRRLHAGDRGASPAATRIIPSSYGIDYPSQRAAGLWPRCPPRPHRFLAGRRRTRRPDRAQ